MTNQEKISQQILELLTFTERWSVVHNDDRLKILTTDLHSIFINGKDINYVEVNKDKPVDDWELFRLKYSVKNKRRFNSRIKQILK